MNIKSEAGFQEGRAWIELNIKNLRHNVRVLRECLPAECRLMPAVKAEAYGHGAVLISKELNNLGVQAFCVASASEGVELRENGIEGEILILGYTHPNQFELLEKFDLIQTVVDYEYAEILNSQGHRYKVHIGIDTGMHRLGENSRDFEKIYSICQMKNLSVEGVFTHLCADDTSKKEDVEFTVQQSKNFAEVIEKLGNKGIHCKSHVLSSYGIINYPELGGDYARAGIALYGLLCNRGDLGCDKIDLKPVLSLKARVASVRELKAGEGAGYGLAFVAARDSRICTLAIGYADGLPRNLSGGKGSVLINGVRAPIVGRICMDQTIVDVTDVPDISAGDTAVLIGRLGEKEISAYDMAEQAGTITNEILSRLGPRLERVIV